MRLSKVLEIFLINIQYMAWYNGTDTFSEIDIVLLSTRSNQKNSRYTGILYGIIYGVVWCNQRRREKIIFEKVFMVLGLAKGKVQFSKEERRRERTQQQILARSMQS